MTRRFLHDMFASKSFNITIAILIISIILIITLGGGMTLGVKKP